MVHIRTIDSTAHSMQLEHCMAIYTTSMTNIQPGRDSNPVPMSFVPQPDQISHRGRPGVYHVVSGVSMLTLLLKSAYDIISHWIWRRQGSDSSWSYRSICRTPAERVPLAWGVFVYFLIFVFRVTLAPGMFSALPRLLRFSVWVVSEILTL